MGVGRQVAGEKKSPLISHVCGDRACYAMAMWRVHNLIARPHLLVRATTL